MVCCFAAVFIMAACGDDFPSDCGCADVDADEEGQGADDDAEAPENQDSDSLSEADLSDGDVEPDGDADGADRDGDGAGADGDGVEADRDDIDAADADTDSDPEAVDGDEEDVAEDGDAESVDQNEDEESAAEQDESEETLIPELLPISPDDLHEALTHKDFLLINVHVPYAGEIPGTDTHIPYNDPDAIRAYIGEDLGRKIVLYCMTNSMSGIAGNRLIDDGYWAVRYLDGGMNAWAAAGYPFSGR